MNNIFKVCDPDLLSSPGTSKKTNFQEIHGKEEQVARRPFPQSEASLQAEKDQNTLNQLHASGERSQTQCFTLP